MCVCSVKPCAACGRSVGRKDHGPQRGVCWPRAPQQRWILYGCQPPCHKHRHRLGSGPGSVAIQKRTRTVRWANAAGTVQAERCAQSEQHHTSFFVWFLLFFLITWDRFTEAGCAPAQHPVASLLRLLFAASTRVLRREPASLYPLPERRVLCGGSRGLVRRAGRPVFLHAASLAGTSSESTQHGHTEVRGYILKNDFDYIVGWTRHKRVWEYKTDGCKMMILLEFSSEVWRLLYLKPEIKWNLMEFWKYALMFFCADRTMSNICLICRSGILLD